MKFNKKFTRNVLIVIYLLIILGVCLNFRSIRTLYLEVFRMDGVISNYNEIGLPDGEYIEYLDGKVVLKQNFKDGLREGWVTEFYPNGGIKRKGFFYHDRFVGNEYGYYDNGILKYKSHRRNGIPYGGLYWYDIDGKLNAYHVHGVNGEKFCTFLYDKGSNIKEMTGLVADKNFFSLHEDNGSLIIIDTDLYHPRKYKSIRDLYAIVATPPNLIMKVNVTINNKIYKDLAIHNNTIKIPNAFTTKGTYTVLLESYLVNKFNNKGVNGINIKKVIIKE